MKSKQAQIREALLGIADSVGRKKNGNIIVRRGFFYRHGMTEDSFAQKVSDILTRKGFKFRIVECYEQWKPFRGGDSVAQGSHFGVELSVE